MTQNIWPFFRISSLSEFYNIFCKNPIHILLDLCRNGWFFLNMNVNCSHFQVPVVNSDTPERTHVCPTLKSYGLEGLPMKSRKCSSFGYFFELFYINKYVTGKQNFCLCPFQICTLVSSCLVELASTSSIMLNKGARSLESRRSLF